MKKTFATLLLLCSTLTLAGCQAVESALPYVLPPPLEGALPSGTHHHDDVAALSLTRFHAIQLDLMDTVFQFIGYASNQESFDAQIGAVKAEMERLHNLFTTFEEVLGVNNLWTVNQQAGIAPVTVDPTIISLVELGIEAYHQTDGLTNIAMGAVIGMWQEQRVSENPVVPRYADLRAAKDHVDINDVIVNTQANTIFIDNPHMALDVGAIAKGYAVERAVEVARSVGLNHFLISAGGDVRMSDGPPATGRWATGIQNPLNPYDPGSIIDAIRGANMSVVTSGTYQRYFEMDGERFHHIIDPRTLFPSALYQSLTIIHEDAVMAEVLSTVLYMLTPEESQPLLNELGGYALWITYDGEIFVSDGYSQFSDNF